MEYTLIGLRKTYCFLANFILANAGLESDHTNYVIKCLQKLYEKNLSIILHKCHFDRSQIESLGYNFTHTCILPFESNTAAL